MKSKFLISLSVILFISSCKCNSTKDTNLDNYIKYNIVEPGNGIYVITKKDVPYKDIVNNAHEAIYYENNKVIKIERYNNVGKLTDNFSVAAITSFEYDLEGNVKYIKYFDKNGSPAEDELFGYWSIEYIYDDQDRVRMEIYRDSDSKFLTVPRDNTGEIAKINFIAPVLTYEYLDDKLKIKALDRNFNLLKEVYGDKPCIPFIDCGENE